MSAEDPLFELRADGDPAADELLQEAVQQSGRTAAEILAGLRKPTAEMPSWLHDLLDRWAQQGPELPSWSDSRLMAAGQRFFDDYDLAICTALFTASLPSAYAGAQGVVVLTCGTWGNVIRLLPPLTIDEALLVEGLDVLAEATAGVLG